MTINALLDAATERERLRPSDARSGATFERFRVGGRRYFTERVRPECDLIMRVTGDRDFRTAKAWHAGLLRRAAAAVVQGAGRRGGGRRAGRADGRRRPLGHARPAALAAALARTPSTFLHGDPKMGNLGRTADGRAILLDWAYPGAGPATWELGWYLALNAARLPESKEDAIDRYGMALRRRGVPAPWFDHQLALALLGVTATFAWEKALGGDDELGWWSERALRGAALLDAVEPGWR